MMTEILDNDEINTNERKGHTIIIVLCCSIIILFVIIPIIIREVSNKH
jgi:hypothetical protein